MLYCRRCSLSICLHILIHFLFTFTGDLQSKIENPWSKYLLASKFEEDLDTEYDGRYKGIKPLYLIVHDNYIRCNNKELSCLNLTHTLVLQNFLKVLLLISFISSLHFLC